MPSVPGMKALPWMRVVWMAQIVASGIMELEAQERRRARELLMKLAKERRLNAKEREQLRKMATKVGRGAVRGARPGGRKKRRS
jgi:hypothetical protein